MNSTGAVTGTEYAQSPGLTKSMAVSGTFTVAADGSGSLTLNTQVDTEDGAVSAVTAVYDFLQAKAGGFVAIRRDGAAADVAEMIPASTDTSVDGSFALSDEGFSPSGQKIAQVGMLNLKGDGSLGGKLVVKQNSESSAKAVDGSYAVDSSGFGTLKLITPGPVDDDGGTTYQTTPFVFAISAKHEIIALRTDNSLLGVAHIEPVE